MLKVLYTAFWLAPLQGQPATALVVYAPVTVCAQVIMHDDEHLAHLALLFNNTKYSDMVLVAEAPWGMCAGMAPERRRFYCHRAILASRSSYFDRMFGSGARPLASFKIYISVHPFLMWEGIQTSD